MSTVFLSAILNVVVVVVVQSALHMWYFTRVWYTTSTVLNTENVARGGQTESFQNVVGEAEE